MKRFALITRPAAQGKYSPHVGESGFRTRENFRLWTDSGIQEILLLNSESLGFGFRNTAQGIRTAVPGIRNPRHGIQNTRLSWIPWGESVKGVRLPMNGFIRKERFETETGPVRRLVEGNVK